MMKDLDLPQPAVVGFDLDLTLIDTRAATAHALRMVNQELGEDIDVDAFVATLGPPIRDELRRWVPEPRLDTVVTKFRAVFTSTGLGYVRPCSGAVDILSALDSAGCRSIVITSRQPFVASAALRSAGLRVGVVVGGLTGIEKATAINGYGVMTYIGDHPLDMAGAVVGGVPGIGVLTGMHSEAELRAAGASRVVPTLNELHEILRL